MVGVAVSRVNTRDRSRENSPPGNTEWVQAGSVWVDRYIYVDMQYQ